MESDKFVIIYSPPYESSVIFYCARHEEIKEIITLNSLPWIDCQVLKIEEKLDVYEIME